MHDNEVVANLQPPSREIAEDGILGGYRIRVSLDGERGDGFRTQVVVDFPDSFQDLRVSFDASDRFGGQLQLSFRGGWERDDFRWLLGLIAQALLPGATSEMEEVTTRTIELGLPEETWGRLYRLVEALEDEDEADAAGPVRDVAALVRLLLFHVSEGVARPESWERDWLCHVIPDVAVEDAGRLATKAEEVE